MLRSLLSLLVATGLLAIVGRSTGPRGGNRTGVAAAVVAGFAVLVPLLAVAALAGLPIRAWTIAAIGLAAALLLRAGLARAGSLQTPAAPPENLAGLSQTAVIPAIAFGVFAWKVFRVPLWCWDHYAVWGMKSRRMVSAGLLDFGFLQTVPYSRMNAEYPVGLPLGWRVLSLGRLPAELDFKLSHLLFAAGVVLLVRRCLLEGGATRAWADGLAGLVAISPLFWDTESLGIAEMPLAAAALAGLCLVLRPDGLRAPAALTTGVVLGALPWIKKEGLILSLLLLGVGLVAGRSRPGRRRHGLLLAASAWAALAGGALLFEWAVLRPSPNYLTGDWWERVESRLPHYGSLLAVAGRELLSPDWFGFWLLFPAAAALAILRRRGPAVAIGGAVLVQATLYVFVYFATYLDPAAHVRASFFRLMAALLPLATVAIGLAFIPRMRIDERTRSQGPEGS